MEAKAPKATASTEQQDSSVTKVTTTPNTGSSSAVKTRSQQKMQVVKSEPEKINPAPKKTVTFGSVESCSDSPNPVKKVPLKTHQPLVSIIKKKSAFKSTEHSTFHSIVKPAKLTDLGSKSCIDFVGLRSRHNKSPPVKKSSLRFSQLGGIRSVSPPPGVPGLASVSDKDSSARRFILPSHSAHSSRVIKPNKRFIDNEDGSISLNPASQISGKVLKKPKLILNTSNDTSNPCYDEAYETCDSSANSNDSSDSKHLDSLSSGLSQSKSSYLDKTLGLFGSASVKSITSTFQDTFVNGLKSVGVSDKPVANVDSEVPEAVLESGAKLSRRLAQLSRNISETPCTSDQSSSSSESSESEGSLASSDSEEVSEGEGQRPVEKGQTSSQLLSGKVILREARLQLSSTTVPTNNSLGSEGPFSTFGSNPTNASKLSFIFFIIE